MLKKLLLGLCGLFAIGLILFLLFGARIIDRGIREGVTTYGPRLTQTPIELGDVEVSLFNGHATLREFVVGNPEGFSGEYALRLAEVAVAVNVRSLLGDAVVVERIYLSEPLINLEQGQGTTNLQRIQRNINEALGEPDEPPPEDPDGRRFIIEEFLLEGGRVALSGFGQQTEVAMPTVRLEGIGAAEGGVTASEAGAAILDAVIRGAVGAAGQQIGDLLRNPAQAEETIRDAAGRLQRLFGSGDD